MHNHKAFLFETSNGKRFAVVFLISTCGKTMCKPYGYDAFATKEYAAVMSVNYVTRWLNQQGHAYVKRLPLPQGELFNEAWEALIKHWVQTGPSHKCA